MPGRHNMRYKVCFVSLHAFTFGDGLVASCATVHLASMHHSDVAQSHASYAHTKRSSRLTHLYQLSEKGCYIIIDVPFLQAARLCTMKNTHGYQQPCQHYTDNPHIESRRTPRRYANANIKLFLYSRRFVL